jgi:predicted ArsR family transcriptional regulator
MTDDLFRYPIAAGHKARDTSKAAADATPAAMLRDRVLAIVEGSNGLTADECAGRMGLSILSVRPRFSELARLGKVRDGGARRANNSGRKAIVWLPVQPARLNRP